MTVSTFLIGLYPPAIRQRWGHDMAREAGRSGPLSWLDTVVGAVRLWVHPSDWPETATGQTRRILVVEFVAATTVTVLLLRAAGQTSAPLTADLPTRFTSAWLAPILAGAVLAAPLPPPRWHTLRCLAGVTARTLAAPVLALLTLYLVANTGLIDHLVGAPRGVRLGYYWATLGFAGFHLCILTVRVTRITVTPSTARLRGALFLLGSGLALAAVENLTTTWHSAIGTGTLALSLGLAALATGVLATGHDLRHATRPA